MPESAGVGGVARACAVCCSRGGSRTRLFWSALGGLTLNSKEANNERLAVEVPGIPQRFLLEKGVVGDCQMFPIALDNVPLTC